MRPLQCLLSIAGLFAAAAAAVAVPASAEVAQPPTTSSEIGKRQLFETKVSFGECKTTNSGKLLSSRMEDWTEFVIVITGVAPWGRDQSLMQVFKPRFEAYASGVHSWWWGVRNERLVKMREANMVEGPEDTIAMANVRAYLFRIIPDQRHTNPLANANWRRTSDAILTSLNFDLRVTPEEFAVSNGKRVKVDADNQLSEA